MAFDILNQGKLMRFGKIRYLNLLPFDVFIKSYPLPARYKQMIFLKRSYPARLNQYFLFRRIDAGFISTIAGYQSHFKNKATMSGICAKGAVWSVMVLPNTNSKDYQSDTSNALCDVLGLSGEVLIGDRALKKHYEGTDFIDMGEVWSKKTGLPFVFGRLCFNAYGKLYRNISKAFNHKKIKIPHFILKQRALESGIRPSYILEYLKHIHYKIDSKEKLSIKRFYRAVRLKHLSFPKRIYKILQSQNNATDSINQPCKRNKKAKNV